MDVNPYLTFKGDCEAAFKFYEHCFGGTIDMMMKYGESPAAGDVPADWRNKIMHAHLTFDGNVLMGADAPPERYDGTKGFSLSVAVDTPAEVDRLFNALAEKGTVQMPLQQTFFAQRFGMVVDRFGIPWMVICQQPT